MALPSNLDFNDAFFTQDLRVSRTFSLRSERVRLVMFGEVFNVLNTANLVQHDGNIANPAGFAQPGRVSHRFSAPAAREHFSWE